LCKQTFSIYSQMHAHTWTDARTDSPKRECLQHHSNGGRDMKLSIFSSKISSQIKCNFYNFNGQFWLNVTVTITAIQSTVTYVNYHTIVKRYFTEYCATSVQIYPRQVAKLWPAGRMQPTTSIYTVRKQFHTAPSVHMVPRILEQRLFPYKYRQNDML